MLLSLIQTLIFVLLINGGLYALHLNGGGSGGESDRSNSDGSSSSNAAAAGLLLSESNSQNYLSQSNNNNKQQQQHTNNVLNVLAAAGGNQQHHIHQQQHAQHIMNGGGGGGGGAGLGISAASINILSHHQKPSSTLQHHSGRLTEDLADMAQLDRERLMLLGLAKQTAAVNTGHNGRPIVTGRIQMTPNDDIGIDADEADYPGLLLHQAAANRAVHFGSVVKQPTETKSSIEGSNDDYESVEDFDGGGHGLIAGDTRRRPIKYEYGRVVQPNEQPQQQQQQQEYHQPLSEYDPHIFKDFTELEDEMLPDLEGFQYYDEEQQQQQQREAIQLLEKQEQQQLQHIFDNYHIRERDEYGGGGGGGGGGDGAVAGGHHLHHVQNPYRTLEEFDPPPALQELFEDAAEAEAVKHQIQHQKQLQKETLQHISPTHIKQRNGYNIRLQQRWQRKRAQLQQQKNQQQQTPQQEQFQRNIFAHLKRQHQQQQQQQHHFKTHNTKLSIANSEATATKHIDKSLSPSSLLTSSSPLSPAIAAAAAEATVQMQSSSADFIKSEQKKTAAEAAVNDSDFANAASTTKSATADKLSSQQQPQDELIHPNHKRSGGGGASAAGLSSATHSIANQLMMRSTRGQRPYDVPQIECPTAMDGMERFACPTPDLQGRFRCIDDHVLCDGFIDCPEGEDEDRRSCMFYKTTKAHLDVLADALLRWARGR